MPDTVQATIASYDDDAGVGSAFLDDGRRVSFDASALDGLRQLRLGQRVRIEGRLDAITRISLITS